MALTGRLEKMLITPFLTEGMTFPLPPFTPMFNPNTISVTHTNIFDPGEAITVGTSSQKFLMREPRALTVELYFDGTKSSPSSSKGIGINNIFGSQVDLQVQAFLKMAIAIEGGEHRPAFLLFAWGTFIFPAVVESAAVTYSLFDSDGRPIRAKVNITAKEHIDQTKLNQVLRLLSPDLTHSRVIKAGDTLPNLTREIYGDETLYTQVAKANNLKNYRKLTPGDTLIFPPINDIEP
jgi:hypothetical protein